MKHKYISISVLLTLIGSLLACGALENVETDFETANPSNETGLRPGIVLSDEDTSHSDEGTGNFRTLCVEAHTNSDDPLVYPEQPGAAHEHVFFGFTGTDAFTTAETLENAAEDSTCEGGALNQSAYWVPALYAADGERIEFDEPLFYYKSGYHLPAETIQAPPAGLAMVAGQPLSQPQDVVSAKYRCTSWEAPLPQFDEGDPLDHVPYLPECPLDDSLEIRVVFPQCWDGENLTSDDQRSHMAYPNPAEAPHVGTGHCPDSHPEPIPEISYNFTVYVTEATGPSSNWRLSSDTHPSHRNGSSLHADWINGWDPDIMEAIVENCINTRFDCSVGLLGDGTRLQEVN